MSEPPFIIKYMSDNLLLSAADDLRADGPAEPGPQEPDPVLVPLERLEERICELAAHLAAGTCRFLQLVAEFDARGGWATWDLPSCAAWLAWKCQVAPGTAREQVRVARALADLPRITADLIAPSRLRFFLGLLDQPLTPEQAGAPRRRRDISAQPDGDQIQVAATGRIFAVVARDATQDPDWAEVISRIE